MCWKGRADRIQPDSTHLVAPVVHALLVINLLSQPMDDLARRPPHLLLAFLLRHHLVQDGHHPILKRAVIRIGDKQVPNPIKTGSSVQPRLHPRMCCWPDHSHSHPLRRSSAPSRWKSPSTVDPRHLMKSSSIPPAVVTRQSTSLCCARKRSISRRPEEMRLEVYPRKRVRGWSGSARR